MGQHDIRRQASPLLRVIRKGDIPLEGNGASELRVRQLEEKRIPEVISRMCGRRSHHRGPESFQCRQHGEP